MVKNYIFFFLFDTYAGIIIFNTFLPGVEHIFAKNPFKTPFHGL